MKHQESPDAEDRVRSYYQNISAKGKEVMNRKRKEGEIMHKAPLGYKNARDERGRSILVPDPETFPLVQQAKLLRAQGMSTRAIASILEDMGLTDRRGKKLSAMAVWRMTNEASTPQ